LSLSLTYILNVAIKKLFDFSRGKQPENMKNH